MTRCAIVAGFSGLIEFSTRILGALGSLDDQKSRLVAGPGRDRDRFGSLSHSCASPSGDGATRCAPVIVDACYHDSTLLSALTVAWSVRLACLGSGGIYSFKWGGTEAGTEAALGQSPDRNRQDGEMAFEPDFNDVFLHENNFYLTADPGRLAKMLAHYELYRQVTELPGAIVECGVFKGASFMRFAAFRRLFETEAARRLIGFDIFGAFPATAYEADKNKLKEFWAQAGRDSISEEGLIDAMTRHGLNRNVELVAGDILETVPAYIAAHPELKIALLNLDTDVYEPAKCIMEQLYDRVVPGGIIVLDDYAVWSGETHAVDEYLDGSEVIIHKMPYSATPCYIIKE